MASNSFGDLFRITSFGESHGPGLGVVIDGCPPGLPLDVADFGPELARRRPGQSDLTTARQESDLPEILSGVFEGQTTGMPIAVLVRNEDARSQDYDRLRDKPRPGHADETYSEKYGIRDHRGGGRSSGRETLARVIGGVVARKILPAGLCIRGHAKVIGDHVAQTYAPETIEQNPLRCADPEMAAAAAEELRALKEAGDSLGGMVELRVTGMPKGLGDPVFKKLKSELGCALLSVGAVTGFGFGAGFATAHMRGSAYIADREHFGGILGGISTGEDLVLSASIKPTSSIADVSKRGRHDPCIVPRVIPVLEAMVALVLADAWLRQRALGGPTGSVR